MPKAFIMIDVVPGREAAVQDAVRKLAGVQMVYQVTGAHAMIAFVDAEPYEEFGRRRVAVIAGIGVREYYRRLGYTLEDTYMVKRLS